MAERGPNGYRLTLAEANPTEDLEDEIDRREPEYIDQLDLDGDSVDEVILSHSYYESWDYSIWRFDGTFCWREVYSGRGGGL